MEPNPPNGLVKDFQRFSSLWRGCGRPACVGDVGLCAGSAAAKAARVSQLRAQICRGARGAWSSRDAWRRRTNCAHDGDGASRHAQTRERANTRV